MKSLIINIYWFVYETFYFIYHVSRMLLLSIRSGLPYYFSSWENFLFFLFFLIFFHPFWFLPYYFISLGFNPGLLFIYFIFIGTFCFFIFFMFYLNVPDEYKFDNEKNISFKNKGRDLENINNKNESLNILKVAEIVHDISIFAILGLCVVVYFTESWILLIFIFAIFVFVLLLDVKVTTAYKKQKEQAEKEALIKEKQDRIEELTKRVIELKRLLLTCREDEIYMNENPEVLSFRGIRRDYTTNPALYQNVPSNFDIQNVALDTMIKYLEYDIKTLEENIKKRDEFYAKYFIECKHGVKFAFLYPGKCKMCSDEFLQWHIDMENAKKERERALEEERKRVEREIREKKRAAKIEKFQKKLDIYERKLIENHRMSKEELGAAYERYIGYLYEKDGYRVDYNGIKKGKEDKGVDIEVRNKDHLVLVQCKYYSEKGSIHINTFDQLVGTLHRIKRKNPNLKVSAVLCTAYNNLDGDVKEELESCFTDITHRVEPFDKHYPKVKCNIGKNGEKIYHIPGVGSYDLIKIEPKKGERYVKTIKEAEALGFRMPHYFKDEGEQGF